MLPLYSLCLPFPSFLPPTFLCSLILTLWWGTILWKQIKDGRRAEENWALNNFSTRQEEDFGKVWVRKKKWIRLGQCLRTCFSVILYFVPERILDGTLKSSYYLSSFFPNSNIIILMNFAPVDSQEKRLILKNSLKYLKNGKNKYRVRERRRLKRNKYVSFLYSVFEVSNSCVAE